MCFAPFRNGETETKLKTEPNNEDSMNATHHNMTRTRKPILPGMSRILANLGGFRRITV
jgi:hypothetical protein